MTCSLVAVVNAAAGLRDPVQHLFSGEAVKQPHLAGQVSHLPTQ